ncbi:MAG: gliding motility protein GldN [Prevotella sp.]|nr:gliding motility protein GldN [Prevotella sp.]
MVNRKWFKVAVKGILLFYLFTFLPLATVAQPKARRQQQQQAQQRQQQGQAQAQNQGMSMRARLMFPTAVDMPEDVVWRRDIYREIDLNQNANGGLYYPVEPIDKQLNLFTYVFKLALNGYVPVYEYRLDGNELFTDSAKVKMKTILDNFHIYYEEKDGKIRVDNSDIPSAEVKLYYLKESAYFDQANSTFHRKVLAICPVMLREDDFGGEAAKYPLFWVKYSDLAPYLSRQTVMTSNLNNAATMSMEDYFTLNRYEGKIYKTNNMLGRTLAQYCPTDSALQQEQNRIEAELKAFEEKIFGDKQRKDSLDSISRLTPAELKAARKARKGKGGDEATVSTKQKSSSSSRRTKAAKAPKSSVSSSSGTSRISVRRQRH